MIKEKTKIEKLIEDNTWQVNLKNKSFLLWMTFLSFLLVLCLYAYTIQLKNGLGVTGMRDYIAWGLYISNFVFFVAASLIGMLISSVLGLIGIRWITPITRIAEIIAIAFGSYRRIGYSFRYGASGAFSLCFYLWTFPITNFMGCHGSDHIRGN
jgi:hypothetical protein